MESRFETVWAKITQRLQPGQTIHNWGQARGYTGGWFKIDQIRNGAVLVSGGNMTQPRNVSKGDFANIHAVWDRYSSGQFTRAAMTPLSQNSTYIISILHHIEQT